jgi:hypothetical protein
VTTRSGGAGDGHDPLLAQEDAMHRRSSATSSASRCRICGTLKRKLPLYRERGQTKAIIIVGRYTVHLCGADAAATQSLRVGRQVTITGTVRQAGRRMLPTEIDGELEESSSITPLDSEAC